LHLLQNDADRDGLGQRALEVMQTQQGATERTVEALITLLLPASVADAASVERQT
jgi:hypothetical protein